MTEINAAVKSRITVSTWWMTNLPGEGEKELNETVEFILETMAVGAIPRSITPLILFPYTEIYKNNEKYGIKRLLENFKDYMIYSDTAGGNYQSYSPLITHTVFDRTPEKAIGQTMKVKKLIISRLGILEEAWGKTGVNNNVNLYFIKRMINASFL